ncbi:MAG TPA: EAL domain-containing protein [Micromonosporaceae bacterium]|nr:EAL domain-containing protein [Micromonosporaceae bacterium]
MSRRTLMAGYAAWWVALAVLYYVRPHWQVPLWAVIGSTGAVAVAVGAGINRPRRPEPWVLISLALFVFVATDTGAAWLNRRYGPDDQPFLPSLTVDLAYLVMFLLLTGGLFALSRSTGQDRASVLDAVTLTVGVGLLSYVYLIYPRVGDPDLGTIDRITSVAYPLGDVLILAMVGRLVTTAPWNPTVILLAVGGGSLFVGDVIYSLAKLRGEWDAGGPVDLVWMLFYATWGAAALHPSMVRLTEPRVARPSKLTARRLVLLTLCSLIAPVVLLAQAVDGPVTDGGVIALASAVMFVLVLTRLYDAMRTHQRALGRERGLREAGADLVAATDLGQVTSAIRGAVVRLLPPDTRHRVVFADPTDDRPAVGGGLDTGAAATGAAQPAELRHIRDLPPDQARQLAGFQVALRSRLALRDGLSGERESATLLVAADAAVLVSLRDALDVLVVQATLALERIRLNDEINQRNSEAYFRTLVLNTSDVILILDDDDRIRYASPSAEDLFGHPRLAGRNLLDLLDPTQRGPIRRQLGLVRAGGPVRETDWTVVGAGGGRAQVEASCRDLRDDPTVDGLVVTLRDVTERRRLEGELIYRAYHDALTGLANRTIFTDRVTQAVQRARRSGSVAGVLFLDLDDFKVVNDTLGHAAGDDLLLAAAGRLSGVLRPDDIAARLGGDEFAALIEDARDPVAIERVADRIVAALSAPFTVGDHVVNGAVSVGVATTLDADGTDELLKQADLALYVAKGAGKGRWRRYQPALHAVLVEKLRLRSELDQAVAADEFSLRFQPIVGLVGGDTVGFEALVRWEHPTRGPLLPGEFIDVAEETGLIVPIGNHVLEHAVRAALDWQRHSPAAAAPYVSINVSARQFRTAGFVDAVRRQLLTGVPEGHLMLEITESLLLREDEQIWADLAELRELGVRVAIDDFGTGYSSLSYLRQVPLDVVKIDRSFIDTISSSPQQRALVEGIVQLAHTLGLDVIAEGIESPAERAILVAIGCPYGQGHLFAEPLTPVEATGWLLAERTAA